MTNPDTAIDTATIAELERIGDLVRGASGRIAEVPTVVDSGMSSAERHQLEQAAQELRHALEYLDG